MLELLFPKVCGMCNRICKQEICIKCNKKLKNLNQTNIAKIDGQNYSQLAYLFKYDGIIRKKLIEYKFYEAGYLYKTFSKIFLNNKKIVDYIKNYDIIIPVPVHKKRKNKRGYNQTELIAKKLSIELEMEFGINIIEKIINTKPQSLLNQDERKSNSKNVYSLKEPKIIKDKNVLVLDDIYTTGSTVNECSRILNLANPKSIGVLVIAKD